MGLQDLPVELLLLILPDLPGVSIGALYLTSWRLHNVVRANVRDEPPDINFYKHLWPTSRGETQTLLEMFERDDPRLYLCQTCDKLHVRPDPTREGPRFNHLRRKCSVRIPLLTDFQYSLEFSDLYLAIRRQNMGHGYGMPATAINTSLPWRRAPARRLSTGLNFFLTSPDGQFNRMPDYHEKLDVEIVFFDDQLALHIQERVLLHPRDRWQLSRNGLSLNRWNVCQHFLRSRLQYLLQFELSQALLKEQSHGSNCSSAALHGIYRVTRCPICPTEFKITVYDHGSLGIEILFERFQNMGKCKSMDDLGWAECYGPNMDHVHQSLYNNSLNYSWGGNIPLEENISYLGVTGVKWENQPAASAVFDQSFARVRADIFGLVGSFGRLPCSRIWLSQWILGPPFQLPDQNHNGQWIFLGWWEFPGYPLCEMFWPPPIYWSRSEQRGKNVHLTATTQGLVLHQLGE